MRKDNRPNDEIRQITIKPNYLKYAEGSALISNGDTKVICSATIEETIPTWIKNSNKIHGWITAEYGMLPRSTHSRNIRDIFRSNGRRLEISRFIGRSLRSAINLEKLGPRTCMIDCDVIQADGGTRTASVTGGYVALAIALLKLINQGSIPIDTIKYDIAAISCGILDNDKLLDLDYKEDKQVDVDANIVMNGIGEFIEVQLTSEGKPIAQSDINELLALSSGGLERIFHIQREILEKIKDSQEIKIEDY